MSEPLALKVSAKKENENKGKEEKPALKFEEKAALKDDIRAMRAEDLRKKALDKKPEGKNASLGALKIKPQSKDTPENFQSFETQNDNEEPVLLLSPANAQTASKRTLLFKAIYAISALATTLWFGYVTYYGVSQGLPSDPAILGALIAGVFLPPTLLWLLVERVHKKSDIEHYSRELREELQNLLFPSEETSSLINKDVERLCRQAAEVSAASKAVLKSLQRARQGLRAEIRDFSGVSKKAEFHIDRLAESLGERGSKLLSLTEEIETRTANIDASTRAGAEAWDQATLSVLERTAEMEAAITKGTEKLFDAATRAGQETQNIEDILASNVEKLNESVDHVSERLSDVTNGFESHTIDLTNTADRVSDETERLAETIRDQIEGLESVTDRTVKAMTESTQSIQEHRQALDEGAQSVADQSEKIADTIDASISRLNNTVNHVRDKTDDLETRIDEQSQSLNDAVQGITGQADHISRAGEEAANQLSEGLSIAMSGAKTIHSNVQSAMTLLNETADNATKQSQDLIENTKTQIAHIQDSGQGSAKNIQELLDRLDQSNDDIQNTTQSTREHVETLTQTIKTKDLEAKAAAQNLSERIEKITHSLSSPLKEIEATLNNAESSYQQIETVLGRRVADLNDASDKAIHSAENIRDLLRGQAQEISSLSGQISGNARSINEQMKQQKELLNTEIDQSISNVERVTQSLQIANDEIAHIAQTSQQNIGDLGASVQNQCSDLSANTADICDKLHSLDKALESKITLVQDQAENAAHAITNMHQSLKETSQDIDPITQNVILQAKDVQEKLQDLKIDYESTTLSNLDKLKAIGVVFDQRLETLKAGADDAATILKSSSDHLQHRTHEIETAANDANERMQDVTNALKEQSSDIHLVTDTALLKVEKIQDAVNDQFHELAASVGQAVSQIGEVGNAFEAQTASITRQSEKTAEQFEDLGVKAREETGMLYEAVQKTAIDTEHMVASVQQEAENLLKNAENTLHELKKSGDSFALRAHEMAEQMKASLQTSEDYGHEIRAQSDLIAKASTHSSEVLGKSVSSLKAKIAEIGDVANDVNIKIEDTREHMNGEAERFLGVSTAALEGVKEASHMFGRQSEALLKAAKDAQIQAAKIEKTQQRKQREAFMSDTKFIVESLHSMSVDLSRMSEGEVSDKTWKAFQKGEINAFTQRLNALGDVIPLEKLRKKHVADAEFRTCVQRFIRQFEEIYTQAVENDHGTILSTTIGSSDLAKLYTHLCKIATKDSVLSSKT